MKLYMEKVDKGINAVAEFDPSKKQFIVLKGSKVSSVISDAPTFRSVNTVIKFRTKYVVNGEVVQDVCFKSSSSAGNFVTGRSTDGLRAWKDENGKTLKSILSDLEE